MNFRTNKKYLMKPLILQAYLKPGLTFLWITFVLVSQEHCLWFFLLGFRVKKVFSYQKSFLLSKKSTEIRCTYLFENLGEFQSVTFCFIPFFSSSFMFEGERIIEKRKDKGNVVQYISWKNTYNQSRLKLLNSVNRRWSL